MLGGHPEELHNMNNNIIRGHGRSKDNCTATSYPVVVYVRTSTKMTRESDVFQESKYEGERCVGIEVWELLWNSSSFLVTRYEKNERKKKKKDLNIGRVDTLII